MQPSPMLAKTSVGVAGVLAILATGCQKDSDSPTVPSDESPFASVEVAARSSELFSNPWSGVPLSDGAVAFIATLPATEEEPARAAVLRGEPDGEPSVLYAGSLLANPLDLDLSVDGTLLFVADSVHLDADGQNAGGAILELPLDGSEPRALATGHAPRAVTVGDSGEIYFSGRDPEDGAPGVFRLADGAVERVYSGAPLVDPSGIAVFADGRVLVADTRLGEGEASELPSRGGVVLLEDGEASVFAAGFETGYPAGIALTADDATLIVSGQGPDSSNLVFLFATANPAEPAYVETAFAGEHWSSAGLHRAHGTNRLAWCDRSASGGTIYTITAR